ncbi:uncharacterized protein [Amphiura filiformis]|uniref:uncharacterized protein n=1 Tax=Amphiura filiformis TaxID=82378 RepID=UPI003B21126A
MTASCHINGWSNLVVFHSCQPACIECFHVLYVFDTLQFLVVFTANSVMYGAIVRRLVQRSDENIGVRAGHDADTASKLSRDVARMLVINGVAFFILLGPYQIWNIVLLIYDYTGILVVSENFEYWLGWVSRFCAPINFFVNPLIYGGSNKYYRQAFLEVFGCSSPSPDRRTGTQKDTSSTNVYT